MDDLGAKKAIKIIMISVLFIFVCLASVSIIMTLSKPDLKRAERESINVIKPTVNEGTFVSKKEEYGGDDIFKYPIKYNLLYPEKIKSITGRNVSEVWSYDPVTMETKPLIKLPFSVGSNMQQYGMSLSNDRQKIMTTKQSSMIYSGTLIEIDLSTGNYMDVITENDLKRLCNELTGLKYEHIELFNYTPNSDMILFEMSGHIIQYNRQNKMYSVLFKSDKSIISMGVTDNGDCYIAVRKHDNATEKNYAADLLRIRKDGSQEIIMGNINDFFISPTGKYLIYSDYESDMIYSKNMKTGKEIKLYQGQVYNRKELRSTSDNFTPDEKYFSLEGLIFSVDDGMAPAEINVETSSGVISLTWWR